MQKSPPAFRKLTNKGLPWACCGSGAVLEKQQCIRERRLVPCNKRGRDGNEGHKYIQEIMAGMQMTN